MFLENKKHDQQIRLAPAYPRDLEDIEPVYTGGISYFVPLPSKYEGNKAVLLSVLIAVDIN